MTENAADRAEDGHVLNLAFLARSLDYGGAERQLVEIAGGLKRLGHAVRVITFYPGGGLAMALEQAGVPVISLDKHGRWDVIPFFFRLMRELHKQKPDCLYAFLGVPCIVSALAKWFVSDLKIVWGVRAANMDLSRYDGLSRFSYRLECVFSFCADLIIANSFAGRDYAAAQGFSVQKMIVIPNGIDTEKFSPCRDEGLRTRNQWGVADKEILVGLVARLDVMKDHPTFIRAAAMLASQYPHVKFVCVGDGAADYRQELIRFSIELGLHDRIIWAGAHENMVSVYNALDITVLSSYGEGFPNVIAEAMACGIPCVVTDVGDSTGIVGDDGVVVPPNDPKKLAAGIIEMIDIIERNGDQIPERVRERICRNFGLDRVVDRTEQELSKLC